MSWVSLLDWNEKKMDGALWYKSLYQQREMCMKTEFHKNTKKVPINLHQWLLGAEAENNVLLPLPESICSE